MTQVIDYKHFIGSPKMELKLPPTFKESEQAMRRRETRCPESAGGMRRLHRTMLGERNCGSVQRCSLPSLSEARSVLQAVSSPIRDRVRLLPQQAAHSNFRESSQRHIPPLDSQSRAGRKPWLR